MIGNCQKFNFISLVMGWDDGMGSCRQKCTFPSSDDCLLKVKWAPDNDDGYLNFHSVSGDGRVSNWTLVKVLMIIIFFKVFMVMVIMMLNL